MNAVVFYGVGDSRVDDAMPGTKEGRILGSRDPASLEPVLDALREEGATAEILASREGRLDGGLELDRRLLTMGSVLYDAVLVAGGACSADALRGNGAALRSIAEAYKQARPVGALGEGVGLLRDAPLPGVRLSDAGSADGNAEEFAAAFAHAIEGHRHFER